MRIYHKLVTAGVALSIVGVLVGCGNANNTMNSVSSPSSPGVEAQTPSPLNTANNHVQSTSSGSNTTGTTTTNTTTNTRTGSAPAYVYEISWHGEVYYVSKNISKVGNQIGIIDKKVNENHVPKSNKTISNFAPTGSKVFSVPGTDQSKAIAFQFPSGQYWEAFAYKNQ